MSYSVEWAPDAISALGTLWLMAPATKRQAITSASAAIDRLLAADPLRYARAVSEGLYGINVSPLRALFEVSDDDQVVRVVSVYELA
jgi:hypothetical protein